MRRPPTTGQTVPRPRQMHRATSYPYDLIRSTADTGQAVAVPLDGRTPNTVSASIRQYLFERGYDVHVHNPKDGTLVVWCDHRRPAVVPVRAVGR